MTLTMGIKEVLENFRDVLKDRAEIKSYCQGKFQKDHKVFLGVDPKNPPAESDFPALAIVGIKVVERGQSRIKYSVAIGVLVKGGKEPQVSGNSSTHEAFVQAEELNELAEEAIIKSQKFMKVSPNSESVPNELFPLFTTITYLLVEQLVSSRGF